MDHHRLNNTTASNISKESVNRLDSLQPMLLTELPPLSTIAAILKCSWCRRFPSEGVWVCDDNHTICARCMEVKSGESCGLVAGCPMLYNVDGSHFTCTSPVTASTSLINQVFSQAKFMCPFVNCGKSFFLSDINKHASQCDKRLASVSCFSEACLQTLDVSDYFAHLRSVHSAQVFYKSFNVFNIPFKMENFEVECVLGVYDVYGERFLLVKQETKSKYVFFCFVLNKDHANDFNVHFDLLIRGSSVKNWVGQIFPETNSIHDLILRDGFITVRKDNVVIATNPQGYWHLRINISNRDKSSVNLTNLPMQTPVVVSVLPVLPIPAKNLPPPPEPIPVRAPRLNLPVAVPRSVIPPSHSQIAGSATSIGTGTGTKPPLAVSKPIPKVNSKSKDSPSCKDKVDKKSSGVRSKSPRRTQAYYTVPALRTIKSKTNVTLPIPTKVTNKAYNVASRNSSQKVQHGEVRTQNRTGTNNQIDSNNANAQAQASLGKGSEIQMKHVGANQAISIIQTTLQNPVVPPNNA